MEESIFYQNKLWIEVLDLSVILTQLKSLMSTLLVNVSRRLVCQISFGQGKPKLHANNSPTSMPWTQKVHSLEDQPAMVLQEVNLINIWVGGRVITIGKYSFGSL